MSLFKKKDAGTVYEINTFEEPTFDEFTFETGDVEKEADIKEKRQKPRIRKIILIAVIAYSLFLFIGYKWTPFREDEDGNIKAGILSVEKKETQMMYEDMYGYYTYCERIMAETDALETQMAAYGAEVRVSIATKYAELLEELEYKLKDLQGLSISAKYENIHIQLITMVGTNLASLLSHTSDALINSDAGMAAKAASDKAYCIDYLKTIRGNIMQMCNTVDLEWVEPDIITKNPLIEMTPTPTPTPIPKIPVDTKLYIMPCD